MSDQPVVGLDAVSVRYGRRRAAAGVSFTVARGSVTALLGRNGAGKSSLVRCLLGQQKPQAGRCTLFGVDVWRSRVAAMRRTGVVPEDPDLPPEMSARQLAAFSRPLYPTWDGDGLARRLARFKVPTATPAAKLSKGQRAQVQLALALAPTPELLVLDDPTLGLDAVARREFYEELVTDLADRGTTVLVATHDLEGIERIADHVVVLREGRMLVDEGLEALKARCRRLAITGLLGPGDVETLASRFGGLGLRMHPWGAEMIATRFGETTFATLAGDHAARIEAAPVPLEDIFIAIQDEKGVTP